MVHICKLCDYQTDNKSNYNRHIKSSRHIQKSVPVVKHNIVNPETPQNIFVCKYCNIKFTRASSLTRHKKICIEEEFNEKLKQKELEIKLEYSQKLLEKAETENKELKQYIKTVKPTTYNISVKKYIQQTFPDAPHLIELSDYSIMEKNESKLINTLIIQQQNESLYMYFGDFIVTNYKKGDPTDQSIWNSDVSRLTYIVKELLANNKSCWNHDPKGIKTKSQIINPLLKYVRELVEKYIDIYADKIADEITTLTKHDLCDINEKLVCLATIKGSINNEILAEEILKYIAPHFHIQNKEYKAIQN